jgi:hypothetical protein
VPQEPVCNQIPERILQQWPNYIQCALTVTLKSPVLIDDRGCCETEQVSVAVMLSNCIRQVLSSNLGRNTNYPEALRVFLRCHETNSGIVS